MSNAFDVFDPAAQKESNPFDAFDSGNTSIAESLKVEKPASYVGRGEFASEAGAGSTPTLEKAVNDPVIARVDAFAQGAGVPISKQGLSDTLSFLLRNPVQDVKDIVSDAGKIPSKIANLRETLANSPLASVIHHPLSKDSFGVYGTTAGMLLPLLHEAFSGTPIAEPALPQEAPKVVEPTETSVSPVEPLPNEAIDAGTARTGETTPSESIGSIVGQENGTPPRPSESSDVTQPENPSLNEKPPETIANEQNNQEIPPATEGQIKTEDQAPVSEQTQDGDATASASGSVETTGVANRILDAEADAGKIDKIAKGEGMTWQEMVQLGRDELNKGVSPQEIAARLQKDQRISPTDFAVLRAERERLAVESNKAAQAMRDNPSPENQAALDTARKTESKFIQDVVQPAKTSTSDIFRGMQNEAPIDATTFEGLRRALLDQKGREPTAAESGKLEKRAQAVRKAQATEAVATEKLGKAIDKSLPKTRVPTLEELQAEMSRMAEELAPCK